MGTAAALAGQARLSAGLILQVHDELIVEAPEAEAAQAADILKEAVNRASIEAPLRRNAVETFDEYNTGRNVGKGTPSIWMAVAFAPSSEESRTRRMQLPSV